MVEVYNKSLCCNKCVVVAAGPVEGDPSECRWGDEGQGGAGGQTQGHGEEGPHSRTGPQPGPGGQTLVLSLYYTYNCVCTCITVRGSVFECVLKCARCMFRYSVLYVRCIHCVCASCVFETSLTLTGHRRCRMLSVLVDWLNQREMNCRTRSRAQPPRRKLTHSMHI